MIHFYNQDSTFEIKQKDFISTWILNTFLNENVTKKIELSIIFCSDNALLKINKEFLNHDYYTDIITFPIEEDEISLETELYISIDRVKENAKELSKKFDIELNRVIIHGVLHLCGYGDKTEIEIKEMRTKENFYLAKMMKN